MLGLCCCVDFLLWTAGLLSSCRVGFSLLELLLFQSMGFIVHGLQLWLLGSRAHGIHGFSRSAACGIFLDQGLNSCLLFWQMDYYPLRHQGSP